MRIKTQLVALVAGVAVPLVALAAFVTSQLWQQQHENHQQRFLERASAVRLALDTEFDSTVRTLRATGDATDIPAGEAEVVVPRRFRRLLDNYPDWIAVARTDAQGRVILRHVRDGTVAVPSPGPQDLQRALASANGYVSDVQAMDDGRHVVFIAAAIMRAGVAQGVVYAVIDHAHWLELLRTYPVSKRGILTLLDGSGAVVARTQDDAQWVGRRAPAGFWDLARQRSTGAFKTTGLDGRSFYAAFSRSNAVSWVVSTGVPEAEVDEALYRHTLAVLVVSAAAILGALAVAWRLGRDINASLRGLESAANAMAGEAPLSRAALPNREARAVNIVLANAHQLLREREASLNAALEREGAARERAESGSRAKDQFLAMMGHELRNPLNAITAAAEVLRSEPVPPAVLARSREVVTRQAQHLTGMINDLMDVAQLDSGDIVLHKARVDLAQVAAKVASRFDETGRCAHLRLSVECVPAWIEADEARVELLLTCLLDNACKYTPQGGAVSIEVRIEAGSSVVCVRDSGIGIAPDLAGKMFDAFTQGMRGIERAEGGLGLGLALAFKLASLHGGTLTAASEGPGRGAVFTATFPSATAPVGAVAAPTPGPRDLLLTVVEDMADNREMLVMLLEASGRRVGAAGDGPSGVQAILDGPSDVALVDLGLPGFDGLEVARRVRQSAQGSRVVLIALTGYGTESDRARALAAGFDDFLVKPFDPDHFEASMARGLAAKGAAASARAQ